MSNEIVLTEESKLLIKKLNQSGDIDLRPSFKVIGIGYRKEVKQIFDREQPRGLGLQWAPLSLPYARYKEKKYPGKGILERTGKLKRSMTKQASIGNISLIGNVSAVFGSSVFYGKFLDEGTSKMPARNFSEPSDRRRKIWLDQIERDIIRQFEAKGIKVTGSIFK